MANSFGASVSSHFATSGSNSMSHTGDILYDVSNARANSEIRSCIANSQGLTAGLSGSRVSELRSQLFTACVHFAPQIASCVVVPRRLALSLVLVKVVCRRVASSGEKRINTFTRLRSRVRVPQRPLRNRIRRPRSQRSLARIGLCSLLYAALSIAPHNAPLIGHRPNCQLNRQQSRRILLRCCLAFKCLLSRQEGSAFLRRVA